jgi:Winged helix-turn helix
VKGEISMTIRELSRVEIIIEISQNKLSQIDAAKTLGLSVRQIQRLCEAFKKGGIVALVSRKRGKRSNHQLQGVMRARVLELVTCERYDGFAPQFMREKLEELHGIKICKETTRQLMIESGVWEANQKKRPVIHQQRERRARYGELVQIDGSPHAWFEDRGDSCTLIVFIDDATGLTHGRFCESETTENYMIVTWEYLMKHGRPIAFYSDKHGIFRVNKPGCIKKECITQFGRALKELDIELICANSPQAKGRVERANRTLQDRLVKDMRLAGVTNMEEGNAFLENYWGIYNKKFSKSPKDLKNEHRKVLPEQDLSMIFSIKENRIVSKNLEIQYYNKIYQIIQEKPSKDLCKAIVTVLQRIDGKIFIEYKGHKIPFKEYGEQEYIGKEVDLKGIDRFLKEVQVRKIPHNHPWRQDARTIEKMKKEAECW